ncbi:MAG: hypothetical protein IJN86_07465 [Clostridia bacterium]|nr:hypothetical protein [Clostridia bacterium]
MFKLENDRGFLYQWDTDQRLTVNDPDITEAHFSNGTSNNAVVCQIYEEDGQRFVDIPNALLQKAIPINVYAFLPNYTKSCRTFSVSARPKPEDYVFTEEELNTWEKLNDRLTSLEKKGGTGADGYTPVKGVDYWTEEDKGMIRQECEQFLISELASRGQLAPEFAESEEWLANKGDTNKLYVLPDGYIYAYMLTDVEVESGPAYTNKLPSATDTDRVTVYGGYYNGDGVNDGYITGYRLSSSGGTSALSNACASGFIPAKVGDVLRIKGITPIQGTATQYVITYNSSNAVVKYQQLRDKDDSSDWSTVTTSWWKYENGIITITLESGSFGTDFDAIRFSAGTIDNNTIVTVNEEIVEGGTTETVKEHRWANTGHAFVPADYEDRILDLEDVTVENRVKIDKIDTRLKNVESGSINLTDEEKLIRIRLWDAPIYDKAPVFLLDAEKTALTSADKTVSAVYAKYDALMAEHPDFITRTDLGLCSDGVTHVYRYDFKEKESRHQSGFEWSESKPKFIVVTGIHREWNGIYSMYNALAEITTNSELAELRRNVHFIVVPVLNPYSISGPYATVGHAANANGVEIHRNFEVGFTVSGEGTIHYTGEAPLSEVESQYLNNILANNNDAAYFLTCHSFDRDKTWGVGFLWGSSATKYMCNMAFRVIDKMGRAWHEKYGTTWENGIKAQNDYLVENVATYPNAKALEDGDYRIGHAALTNTGGCEQRQATKYGIQATNFEVGETFFVLDETMLSAKAVTHGTEAYINFFLTAMGVYPETRI